MPTAELPLIVQFVIVMEPELSTPPPNAEAKRRITSVAEHVLLLMVELVIINEPPESFNIPPPSDNIRAQSLDPRNCY